MKKLILNLLGIFLLLSCNSQKRILIEANRQFETFEYDLAINSYKEYFAYNPTNEVAYKLAISSLKKREFREAEYWYTLYSQTGEMNVSNLYDLVEIYIGNSKFEDARLVLAKIVEIDDSETVSSRWQMLNKSVLFAKEILNQNTIFLLNPLKSVNTAFSEFAYTQFKGEKYFVSDRISSPGESRSSKSRPERYGWTGNGYLQVFKGEFDSLAMDLKSIIPAEEFRGDLHFGPVSLDSTFFFSTFTPSGQQARIGKWNEIIPKINFKDNISGKTQLIPSLPENFLTDPFWEPTSQRLYFAADFEGGYGDLDLYYSQLNANEWETPVNMGVRINSYGTERSPFISQDTLYFSSDGLGGLGGLDIYKIALQEVEGQKPINMGIPYNSNKDDFFFFIDDDLSGTQFLSSDRDGGMGMDDIYYISKIPDELIRRLVVQVVDSESINPLENMVVEVQRQSTNLSENLITNEKGFANFNFNKLDSLINIKVYGSGYLNFDINSLDINKEDTILVSLQKLYLDIPFVFNDILYDFDQYSIRGSENEPLNDLVKNLLANPEINVELRSHTDTRGSTSYNQELSEKRSESVFNFLIRGGVDKSRIFVRSFGEFYPLINCGEDCSLNDHQRNRRTEIVFFYGEFKNSPYSYPSIDLDKKVQTASTASDTEPLISTNVKDNVLLDEKDVLIADDNSMINSSYYYLIVGSFESLSSAEYKLNVLNKEFGLKGYIINPMDSINRFRVAVERFPTSREASTQKKYFINKLKINDIWVLYLDSEEFLFK